MKRAVLIILLLSIGVLSAVAFAATPKNPGPEIINLKMGVMILPFSHRKHQQDLNNECFHCHPKKTGGKIDNWNKETAHQICISCHDLEEKGPVECKQCHKK
ncbi:cytochrome c3 family protein [Geotalea toluenoxydans]|uniref:cytochrome c3 family protein n=1 Tax=Geotalea toluenoxydans TaxID=421624 RepID=UPI0006D048AC|nr:cytochrome c3 family protein [Geotalea toluenoxydans]